MKLEPIAWVVTVEWCGEETGGEWRIRYQFVETDEMVADAQFEKFSTNNFVRHINHEYRTRREKLYASGQVREIVENAFEDAKGAATVMGGQIPFDRTYSRAAEEIEEAIGRAEEWFMTKTLRDL